MKSIYSWIARNLLYKVFPGSKTILAANAGTIIGIINIISTTDLWNQLCTSFGLCWTGSAAYGTLMLLFAEIMKLLRFATGQNHEDPKFQ